MSSSRSRSRSRNRTEAPRLGNFNVTESSRMFGGSTTLNQKPNPFDDDSNDDGGEGMDAGGEGIAMFMKGGGNKGNESKPNPFDDSDDNSDDDNDGIMTDSLIKAGQDTAQSSPDRSTSLGKDNNSPSSLGKDNNSPSSLDNASAGNRVGPFNSPNNDNDNDEYNSNEEEDEGPLTPQDIEEWHSNSQKGSPNEDNAYHTADEGEGDGTKGKGGEEKGYYNLSKPNEHSQFMSNQTGSGLSLPLSSSSNNGGDTNKLSYVSEKSKESDESLNILTHRTSSSINYGQNNTDTSGNNNNGSSERSRRYSTKSSTNISGIIDTDLTSSAVSRGGGGGIEGEEQYASMQELIDDEQRSRASFTTTTRRSKCGWCIDSTIGMKSTKRRKFTLLVLMLLILGGIIGIVVWLTTTNNKGGEESIDSNKNKEFESKDNPQVEILDTDGGGGNNGTATDIGEGGSNGTAVNEGNEEGKGTDFDGLDLTFTFTTDLPSLAPSSTGNNTTTDGDDNGGVIGNSGIPTISTVPTPTVMGTTIMDNDDDDIFGTWSDDTSSTASQEELNGTDISIPTTTSVNNSTNSSDVQQLPEDDPTSYLNVTSLDDDMLSDINVVSFNDTTTNEDDDGGSLSPTMSTSPSSNVGPTSINISSSPSPSGLFNLTTLPTISSRPTTSLSIYPPPPSSTNLTTTVTESKLQITIPGNLTLSNITTPSNVNEQELLIDVLEQTIMDVMNQDVLVSDEEEVIVKDVIILRINGVDVATNDNAMGSAGSNVGLDISGDSPPRVPSELSMPSDPYVPPEEDNTESSDEACIICPNGITAGNDYIPTDFGEGATCKELVDITALTLTKDDESCNIMEVYCCPIVQENPCLICGSNGGLSVEKEDEMPFIDYGDMMTCKELVDFYMALDANSEICLETLTDYSWKPCCPSSTSSPPRVPSDDPMMPNRIPGRQLRGSTRGEEEEEVKVVPNFISRELQSVLQAIDNSTTMSNSTNTSTIVTMNNNTTLEVEFNLLLEETCTNTSSCEDELNTTIYYQTNVTESMVESVDDGSFTTILQENVQSTVDELQDEVSIVDNSTATDTNTTTDMSNTTESNSSSVASAILLFEDVQVVNGEFGTDNSVRVTVTEEIVTTPTAVVSVNDTIVGVNDTTLGSDMNDTLSLMPTASPGPSSMLTFDGTNNATDDEINNATMIPTSSPGPTSPTISPVPTNLIGSSSNDPLSYPPSSNSTLNSLDDDNTTDIICPMDVQQCPDGSYVSRVPQDMCNFAPCDGSMGSMNDTIVDVNNSTTNGTMIHDDGNSTTNGTTITLLDVPTVSPAPTPTQDPLSSSFIPTSDSLFNSSSVSPSSDSLSSLPPTSSPGPTSNLTSIGTENGTVFDDESSLNETIGKTLLIKLQANETLLGTSIDEEDMLLFEPYSPSPINATSCYEQCLGGDEYDGCDTEVVCGGTLPLDLANATTLSFQWDASIDGTKYISIKGSTEPTKIEFMTYIDDCTAPYQEIDGSNITYQFNTDDIFEWQKYTFDPESSFVTIGTCDGCGDKCEVFTRMVFMPDDNYEELDLNFNSLSFSVMYDPQLVSEGENEYEWYTNGYTWIRKPEGGSIELVDKEGGEEEEDESDSDTLSNEIIPTLVIVGDNQEPEDAFPLNECKGNCQSDADCAQDLKCFFTNEGVDTVTGCNGQIEAGRNYCYLPGHIFLIIAGEDQEPESAYPLRQCEGNCQSDEDCAQGLVCFMRDEFEDVTGCYGDGEQGANYCIAANETTLVNNETVIESISLDDLSSPYVMSLSMEGDEELGRYGSSVAISSDGTIVAVSAKDAKNEEGIDTGAVYLYSMTRGGEDNTTSLTLQQVLYGESSKDEFGNTVVLSQDGSRLVVGSRCENDQMGAARIYELEEEGGGEASSWTLMNGGAIIGAYPSGRTGFAVSISHDGNVVAIGSPTEGGGVIRTYKYTDPNEGWIEYGSVIKGLPSREAAGYSISLSDTGSTMAIGFPKAKNSDGSVNAGKTAVYVMAGDEWVVFGQEIYGEEDNDIDGGSVAMSQDGSILVIGGKGHDKVDIATGEVIMSSVGYCRIYEMTQLSSEWEFQYSIKGTSDDERLGTWVAVSSDGNTVACGGVNGVNEVDSTSGVVRLYNRLTEQESTIWPRGEDVFDGATFGASLALDNDGKYVIVGAPTKSRIEDNSPYGIIQVFETTVQEVDEGLIIEEDGDNVTSIQEFNEETNENGTQTLTDYAPGTITIAEDDKDVMTAVISDDEEYMPVSNPNPGVIEYPGSAVEMEGVGEEDANMTVANPIPGVIEYPGSVVEEDTNMTIEEVAAVDDGSNSTSIDIKEFNEADDGNGTVTSIEYAPGTVVVAEEGEDVMTVGLVADDEDEVMTADDAAAALPIVEDEEVMTEGGEEEGPLIFPEAPDNEAAVDDMAVLPTVENEEVMTEDVDVEGPSIFPEAPMDMGMEDMVMGKNSLDAFANDRRLRAAPLGVLQHNP